MKDKEKKNEGKGNIIIGNCY